MTEGPPDLNNESTVAIAAKNENGDKALKALPKNLHIG